MDPTLLTLADILRQNDFFCSAFTGGGLVSSDYGFSKGFDTYQEAEGGVLNKDSAEQVFRVVSEWLDKNKDKNFFLFIHTYQPHGPYSCPSPFDTMFLGKDPIWRALDLLEYLGGQEGIFKQLPENERQNVIGLYDGEIRYTDEMLIKPLIEKLKKMNLYDQTMIIFTSDHGEEFYDHGAWDHRHNLYDESLKVPLIIKFLDSKFRGKKIESITRLIDVLPTIMEELNIDFSRLDIEGKSLIPFLKGKERGDRTFLADIGDYVLNSHIPQKITMNFNRDKLIINKQFSQEDLDFFLSPPPHTPPVEFYDLGKDPFEKKNSVAEKSKLISQLVQKINEIYKNAKKRKTGKAEIDEKLREQLRALGYIR
jgi:arylsulfatase A-like enzyme